MLVGTLVVACLMIGGFYLLQRYVYIKKIKEVVSSGTLGVNYSELSDLVGRVADVRVLAPVSDVRTWRTDRKVDGVTIQKGWLEFQVRFDELGDEGRRLRFEYTFDTPRNLEDTFLYTILRSRGNVYGQGHQCSSVRLELVDVNGNIMRGPRTRVLKEMSEIPLVLRPTTTEPIPLGLAQDGFDLGRVKSVVVHFILAKYPESLKVWPASGTIGFGDVRILRSVNRFRGLIRQPDSRRITRDWPNPAYELSRLAWGRKKEEFFVGINYPWHNYGWDVGKNPYGKPEQSGWSVNKDVLEKDFRLFRLNGISVVRLYVFFDLRTGLYYENGRLIGWDPYVKCDIEAIFEVAGKTGMKVILVLFDFDIADKLGHSVGMGDHPELIFTHEKQFFLTSMLIPLLQDMQRWDDKYGNPVYAIEMMNEPENMIMLIAPGYFEALKSWLSDLANIIHNETSFRVTLGCHSLMDMQRWWDGVDIDAWQFHYYKFAGTEYKTIPHEVDRRNLVVSGPVFAGEHETFNIPENLCRLKDRGYSGVIFWSWDRHDTFGFYERDLETVNLWFRSNSSQ